MKIIQIWPASLWITAWYPHVFKINLYYLYIFECRSFFNLFSETYIAVFLNVTFLMITTATKHQVISVLLYNKRQHLSRIPAAAFPTRISLDCSVFKQIMDGFQVPSCCCVILVTSLKIWTSSTSSFSRPCPLFRDKNFVCVGCFKTSKNIRFFIVFIPWSFFFHSNKTYVDCNFNIHFPFYNLSFFSLSHSEALNG